MLSRLVFRIIQEGRIFEEFFELFLLYIELGVFVNYYYLFFDSLFISIRVLVCCRGLDRSFYLNQGRFWFGIWRLYYFGVFFKKMNVKYINFLNFIERGLIVRMYFFGRDFEFNFFWDKVIFVYVVSYIEVSFFFLVIEWYQDYVG